MKELQRILSFVRRAIDDYDMIQEGDKIAVGVSGGKDSLTLLAALAELRRFYPKKYELVAITIDLGLEGMDFTLIKEFCDSFHVPYIIEKTQIAEIIFDVRQEKSPCSLCSKMRRGALHEAAKKQGCNKVALGHHYDDAVETFMLNLFFEGRVGCFSPKTYLSETQVEVIRPLLYTKEKDILYLQRHMTFPVVTSTCPEDHTTEREKMKNLLKDLESSYDGLSHRIFNAMCKAGVDGFHPVGHDRRKYNE